MKKLDSETVVYEGDGMTLECEVSDREAEVFWSRMGKVRSALNFDFLTQI